MNKVVRTWRLGMKSDTLVDGALSELHCGHKGRLFKVNLLLGREEEAKADVTDSIRQLIPGVQCALVNAAADSTSLSPVTFSYALSYRDHSDDNDEVHTICPLTFAADTLNLFTAPARQGEIALRYAFHTVDTVFFQLPALKSAVTVPNDSIITTDAGWCSVTFRNDTGSVIATREFVLKKPRFTAAEYPEVKRLFEARAALTRSAVTMKQMQ